MSGYNYGPSENELVLNVTSQLLQEMSTRYPVSTALAPTRRKENVLGYDVDVRDLLGIVLQFKRPSEIRARTYPTQLPKPTNTAAPVRFESNIEQWTTLISGFNLAEAFYAIPPVLDGSDLYRALKRTVFVDVYGVLPQTSLLYTVPDGCSNTGGQVLVEGKIRNGSTYQVPPAFVYCLDDIKTGLSSNISPGHSSNLLGLQFYKSAEPGGQFDPERPITDQRTKADDLSRFNSRLETLSTDSTDDEYRISDSLQNAIDDLQELVDSEFRSDTLGPVHAELADTQDLPPVERWKRIFLRTNQRGGYDTDQVAYACDDIEEVTKEQVNKLRNDLKSNADTPPATHLLQRADAEMCMLGRE